MASPLYNNKTLAEQEKKRGFTIGVENAPAADFPTSGDGYVQDPSADDILTGAKAPGLGINWDEPVSMDQIPEPYDVAERLAALSDKRGGYRRFTEDVAKAGLPLGLGSMAPLPPQAKAVLGGLSAAASFPDYARRMVNPEAGEERPGWVESALTALPLTSLFGLRGAGGFSRGAKAVAANPEADMLAGRALAYEGPQAARRAVDPMQRLAQASSWSTPMERLMETPSFKNLPRGNVSKAKPAFQDAPKTPSVFERMKAEGQFAGDRTTGQFEEGPGGLSSLASLSRSKSAPAESIFNDMEEAYGHGLRPMRKPAAAPKSSTRDPQKPLSDMERLAARSVERFGKRYRKE